MAIEANNYQHSMGKKNEALAVVVAQLAERSLRIPEDLGSNPAYGSFD